MSIRDNAADRSRIAVTVRPDPLLARAREEAEGVEVFENPFEELVVEVELEGAEGIEVYDHGVVAPSVLKEGSPGEESLSGDDLGLGHEEQDHRRSREEQEEW